MKKIETISMIEKISPKRYFYPLILVTAVLLIYFPILKNDFLIFWDDQWVVMNDYTTGGINFRNLWDILTKYYHGQYAPLNEYCYLMLYSIFGYNPLPFHLFSLILHAMNACMVYFTIKKLMSLSKRVKVDNQTSISFITALLFCIHPFNVESVAWMSASKVLIYALFYLAATYSFLKYLQSQKIRYYLLTLLLFVCSFLGKEQAVTFPLWMLLIFWFLGQKIKKTTLFLEILPFFLLSFFFGIVTIFSQSDIGTGVLSSDPIYPLWQRIVYGSYSFTEYLFKSILPFKLSYLYPFPALVGESLPSWLLIYPLLLLISLISFWKYISHHIMAFGLLFFSIHIAISLHIIPLSRFAIVADRYAYIASIGICFILSYFFIQGYHLFKGKRKTLFSMLLVCYLLFMGGYSTLRTKVWHNTDTLKLELRELLKLRNDYKSTKK